jgi:serine/threonine protein kinase
MGLAVKRIGTTLVGRYRLESILSKGGMGTIYKATHLELGKVVAVKLFHSYLSEDEALTRRFVNEAKGTANLRHRNIVDIIDIGTDEDNIPFFVMEHLKGRSLKDKLRKNADGLSPAESADIMIQVLTGLHVAHGKGIIHRDLKPGNIFIAREPDGSEIVKILDFGVAKFRELGTGDTHDITTDGSIIGTPSYMSPEQAMGRLKKIGRRSDIYSCGVILYRCLTGINPFKGDTQIETIQNIIKLEVPPPSFIASHIPVQLDEIVLKAIRKDSDKRYQSCKDFISDLKKVYDLCQSRPAEPVRKLVTGEIKLKDITLLPEVSIDQSALDFESREKTSRTEHSRRESRTLQNARLVISAAVAVVVLVIAGILIHDTLSGKNVLVDAGPPSNGTVDETDALPVKKLELPARSFVAIEVKGLPERAGVYVDGQLMKDNPVALERSQTPVLLVVKKGDSEVLRKYIVPQDNTTILLETAASDDHKTRKPFKKPLKGSDITESAGEPSPAHEKPQIDPAGSGEKKAKSKIFKVFPDWDPADD